ncbi:hypothetical protein JCM3774_002133 [Rhodotorula dairenensis]
MPAPSASVPVPKPSFYSRETTCRRVSDRHAANPSASTSRLRTPSLDQRFVPSAAYTSRILTTSFESRGEGAFPPCSMSASIFNGGFSAPRNPPAYNESKRLTRRLPSRATKPPLPPPPDLAPLPTRFSSEDDPSPAWLHEALYEPSFDDVQAIRGAVDGERRKAARGPGKRTRPVDFGWDFARWEAELERKSSYKRRKM